MPLKYLYLDSANVADIKRFVKTDAIAGVTTNPSLMSKEAKGDYLEKLTEICSIISEHGSGRKHLSVEVTTLDPNEMVRQACVLDERLAMFKGQVDLHIKIPISVATLETITLLNDSGVKVNATAAFNAIQAKLAEDAGARVVSFFYRRMLDNAVDADREVSHYINNMRRSPLVICGSIREAVDVKKCWLAGADIVTASAKVIEEMAYDKGTEASIQKFQEDIDRWLA